MRALASGFNKDIAGGALMIVIGLAGISIGSGYTTGTLTRMGPGMFPVALSVMLVLIGLAIAVRGWLAARPRDVARASAEWRGWFCILAGIGAFVVLGQHGGLLPATFAIVFISALGDRTNTLLNALVLAAAVCVVCVVVFWWALSVQFPLIAWG